MDLSVDYHVRVPDECAVLLAPKSKKAILSLHVGRVRNVAIETTPADEVRLDVIPDTPTHANIVGTPVPPDLPDPDSYAERVAAQLVAQSRVAWVKPT